jgi:segregation and condensation protein A
VDINDIPVALITAQYLEHIRLMESLNLDLAGDFLVMAATLLQIKSRLLLPDPRKDGEEAPDPRLELVRPLLQYARFQEASEHLSDRFMLDRDVFIRGQNDDLAEEDLPPSESPIRVSLFELTEAWKRVCSRPGAKEVSLNFKLETSTIGQRLKEIREFLISARMAHFRDLLGHKNRPMEMALSFLAILELARTGFLRLWQEPEEDMDGPRLFLADAQAQLGDPSTFDYR